MTDEKNPILNPQAEGNNATSGSSQFRTVIEEDILTSDSSDYDSDSSVEYYEEISETELKLKQLDEELDNNFEELSKLADECDRKLDELAEKNLRWEWEKEKAKFMETSKEGLAKRKELEKERQNLIKELEKEAKIKELSVITAKGKEVIKSEISKELIEAKETFANFQISETTQEEIKSKISKHVDRVENIWSGENYFVNTLSIIPIVGNITGPIHAAEHSKNLEKRIKKEVKEKLPEVVNKLITTATKDLEKQKKNVLKKMDAVITNREKEVAEAKKVIEALEIINRERENEIKDLREKSKEDKKLSEQKLNKLQGEIRKLLRELETFREKEQNAKNFLKKQREAELKKLMDGQNSVNPSIQDDQERIKQLNSVIDKLRLEIHVLEGSENQRELEVKNLTDTLIKERELQKTAIQNKDNEIARKENELARKMEIANNLQKKLNAEIRDWEAKHQKVSDEKHELDLENTDLKAENKKLKDKYNKAKVEAEEWKTKWEGLQPTGIQKFLKDWKLDSYGKFLTNAFSIAGAFVVLYAISWMWKNVIKETWKNFKGEPEEEPRPRKKEKLRYEDYEEISEVKEKPQSLPEKQPTIIINSNPSPVISKEGKNNGENSPQISSEKTDPIREEKTESEKPVQNDKNGKKAKKKKNKKKVKGESD